MAGDGDREMEMEMRVVVGVEGWWLVTRPCGINNESNKSVPMRRERRVSPGTDRKTRQSRCG